MKTIKAVAPYIHPGSCNFKTAPYEAWIAEGGKTAKAHYPWRPLHGMAYRFELPSLWKCGKEARLRFVEPVSLSFDTFPEYSCYEIIPLIWDCWPMHFEKTCKWFKRHKVKTAIFTSSQMAERMRKQFPEINILTITEGICTEKFDEGSDLRQRNIFLFEMGSVKRGYFRRKYPAKYKELHNKPQNWENRNQEDLLRLLQNSKMTIIFPRNITEPETAQGIETLTQRYWECMLSRILMVGHAPKELVDLIGYNPVIELDLKNDLEQIEHILSDINNPIYQQMVDKNRKTALHLGSWDIRMKQIMNWLKELGYDV